MPNLYCEITLTEKRGEDSGVIFGEEPLHETFTADTGTLFRFCSQEYGRCTGYVYVDSKTLGRPLAHGWVFVKRAHYEDDHSKTYIQETWVSVYEVCTEDDPRALDWCPGHKLRSLAEDESLRQKDLEARKHSKKVA